MGNLRTALFSWLFARRYGGEFIVRVEDTDRERYVPEALDAILDSLRWLGLEWDEGPEVDGPYGPYMQSLRLEHYQAAVDELLDRDQAYRCYCSRERLDEMRKEQQRSKQPPGYDRRCRNLSASERHDAETDGAVPVVRFQMPLSGATTVHDLVRGEVTWQNELLDDFVILKSDGYPTYHLANVVDDHLMEISHVLRAEEWLPSTPRHLELYRTLGYEPPFFAHLPMILGPDKAKLSKRHGATSILEYRDRGFLPEAMVNFMALLGWSLDDKTDVMSRDIIVEHFALERIGKSGAVFDVEKLQWMNGVYIRQMSGEQLADEIVAFLDGCVDGGVTSGEMDRKYLLRIIPLVQERLKTLGDAAGMIDYFFKDDLSYDDPGDLIEKGMDRDAALGALGRGLEVMSSVAVFDAASLEEALRGAAADLGLSGRQFFGTLRVAATGAKAAPPLFDTLEVLGRQRCLDRLWAALATLEAEK